MAHSEEDDLDARRPERQAAPPEPEDAPAAPVTWVIAAHPDFEDPGQLVDELDAHTLELGDGPAALDELPGSPGGPSAAFGTLRQMQRLARHPQWGEAVFDDYAQLRCSVYYAHVYEELGRLTLLAPLSSLERMDLERIFGERVFVRPDANTKPFEGQVVEVDQIGAFVRKHQAWASSLVAISEVVDIAREWRVFCRRGRAFAHSSYPDPPFEPAPDEVLEWAEELARRAGAALGATMLSVDVARLEDDALALVELGGVNGWGLYGADRQDFIEGMEAEARQRFDELWGGMGPPTR